MSKLKSSTLVIATRSPGRCRECRHVNQGTLDFSEGRLRCEMDGNAKRPDDLCDVTRPLPRRAGADVSTFEAYFLFERYDGTNGTFGRVEDMRLLAEDADEALRRSLQADRPFIPG